MSNILDFQKDKTNISSDEGSDYDPDDIFIYSNQSLCTQNSSNADSNFENKENEINDLKDMNKCNISENCSEDKIINDNIEKEIETCKDDDLFVELSRGPKGDK